MKEELQGKLVEILTSIQTAAGKASDFAMEQLPDIAQSYVAYGRVWSVVICVVLACALVAAGMSVRWGYKHPRGAFDFAPFAAGIGGGGMFVVTALSLLSRLQDATLVWFAPKVWLLKEIAGLLK